MLIGNFSSWLVGFTINSAMKNSQTAKRSFAISWVKRNGNFEHVRAMQLCYLSAQLEDITRPLLVKFNIFLVLTREYWNAQTFRSVFFYFCCKILICRVNNSVLDFELFAKTKAFKTFTTIERLKMKENSFYLRFCSSTLLQAERFMSNWCVFATVRDNEFVI